MKTIKENIQFIIDENKNAPNDPNFKITSYHTNDRKQKCDVCNTAPPFLYYNKYTGYGWCCPCLDLEPPKRRRTAEDKSAKVRELMALSGKTTPTPVPTQSKVKSNPHPKDETLDPDFRERLNNSENIFGE